MKKSTLITIAVIIVLAIGGYTVFAKAEPKQDDKQVFLENWTKAGEYKYEEQHKKEQAQKLLDEAEKARIEKEKLLFGTGTISTGFQK